MRTILTNASPKRGLLFVAFWLQLMLFGCFVRYMNTVTSTSLTTTRALGAGMVLDKATHVDYRNSNDTTLMVEKVVVVHPQPTKYAPPQMAWLLSFPNSGTSYTLKLISRLSHTHVATNYGHESKLDLRPSFPVYKDQADVGPFWLDLSANPEYTFPKDVVVVKTHCGGRCESCGPTQYAETTYSFRRACRRGKRRVVGNLTAHKSSTGQTTTMTTDHVQVHYPAARVTKAIHLIRNAFDNVVSRFHMETRGGRSGITFNQTREGFRQYCQGLNERFFRDEENAILFDEDWLEETRDVPCRSDFFRWIEWHNQVFHMTHDMGLETMILEYGSYSTQLNSTSNQLLDFLGLLRHDEPEPFVHGKTYRDYFSADERKKVGTVLEQMASRVTWQHVAKYFAN